MEKMKVSKKERNEALERLRGWVKPGDTVYCVLRSVSRSGMSRVIHFFSIERGEDVRRPLNHLTSNIAKACGYRMDDKRNGHEYRPDAKEKAERLVSQGVKFCGRGGDSSSWDNDSGYALRSEWV